MERTPDARRWNLPAFFASTWLPTILAVGLASKWEPFSDLRLASVTIPGRIVIPAIALIVTPYVWWMVTRRNAHSWARSALAGAVVAAILCAVPTAVLVSGIARDGLGEGEGGLTALLLVFVPLGWCVSLLAGAALGALVGLTRRLRVRRAQDSSDSGVAPPERSATTLDAAEPAARSAWSRWWDRGERRTIIEALCLVMVLPLAVIASIAYIAFEWKRTEVHVAETRAIAPRSRRVAMVFNHRWRWSRASHRHDVRVSMSGEDPARGLIVWESDEVPITRLEWTDQDSLLVHVDLHHDEFVPWLMSTMKTHGSREVALRTIVKLTPDFLMVSNPPRPDDLEVLPKDIRLDRAALSAGDTVTIRATVHNLGLRPAMDTEVEISDDRFGESIGKRKVQVAPGDSTMIEMPWVVTWPDTHEILVRVSPYVFSSESEYTNNVARLRVILAPASRRSAVP